MNSARMAQWRKRVPKSGEPMSASPRSGSTSSGATSVTSRSGDGGTWPGANDRRMPSSTWLASATRPKRASHLLRSAMPQAPLTRMPNTEWIMAWRPPISSENDSTTMP